MTRPKVSRRVAELLLDARRSATMKTANFDLIHAIPGEEPLPTREGEVTKFIQNRTRIYRESWIISPLDEALEALGIEVPL